MSSIRTGCNLRGWLLAVVMALSTGLIATGCDTTYVDSMDHTNEGIRHYNNNQIGKALEELRKAIQIYPENHRAHFQLGMILNGRVKSYDEAIEHFRKAANLRPDDGEYWYYLGAAHQNQAAKLRTEGDPESARQHFTQAKEALSEAVSVDEYHAEAHYRLGQIHHELGEISSAIDAYSNAVHADPTLAKAYNQLGGLYAEYAFLDEAAQVLRNGVANNPSNVPLLGALGQVYNEKESYLEAIDAFDKAFKVYEQKKGDKRVILPSYLGRARAHKALGDRALQKSDIPEATKQYKEARGYFQTFIENAGAEELTAQRMSAGGDVSTINRRLEYLEKGELPQSVIDQRKMIEERQKEEN